MQEPMVAVRHEGVEAPGLVPRWAYEQHWGQKGWVEFDPNNPEKIFDAPEQVAEETAQDESLDASDGEDETSDAAPPEPPAKGGSPKRAAPAADKE